MAATETASRIAPYIEHLLEDETAQKNLRPRASLLGSGKAPAEQSAEGVAKLTYSTKKQGLPKPEAEVA